MCQSRKFITKCLAHIQTYKQSNNQSEKATHYLRYSSRFFGIKLWAVNKLNSINYYLLATILVLLSRLLDGYSIQFFRGGGQ